MSKINNKAIVFNIQKYSLHDGPGIRTTIFLKGCPLGCLWCSNPESQNTDFEMIFSPTKCIGCSLCTTVCTFGAIEFKNNAPFFKKEYCTNCGKCAEVCPTGAREIIGKEMTVSDVMKEVEKDTVFYRDSSGGVTISGGDPIQQSEFVNELALALKSIGIHIAIETSGFAQWEKLWYAVENVDLILYDLKEYDHDLHGKFTKVDNELIFSNAKRLAALKDIIFRIPIIPGYNDQVSSLEKLALFISECKNNSEVHIIPYHSLGSSKYEKLGRKYLLSEVVPPNSDKLNEIANLFTEKGHTVKIF